MHHWGRRGRLYVRLGTHMCSETRAQTLNNIPPYTQHCAPILDVSKTRDEHIFKFVRDICFNIVFDSDTRVCLWFWVPWPEPKQVPFFVIDFECLRPTGTTSIWAPQEISLNWTFFYRSQYVFLMWFFTCPGVTNISVQECQVERPGSHCEMKSRTGLKYNVITFLNVCGLTICLLWFRVCRTPNKSTQHKLSTQGRECSFVLH